MASPHHPVFGTTTSSRPATAEGTSNVLRSRSKERLQKNAPLAYHHVAGGAISLGAGFQHNLGGGPGQNISSAGLSKLNNSFGFNNLNNNNNMSYTGSNYSDNMNQAQQPQLQSVFSGVGVNLNSDTHHNHYGVGTQSRNPGEITDFFTAAGEIMGRTRSKGSKRPSTAGGESSSSALNIRRRNLGLDHLSYNSNATPFVADANSLAKVQNLPFDQPPPIGWSSEAVTQKAIDLVGTIDGPPTLNSGNNQGIIGGGGVTGVTPNSNTTNLRGAVNTSSASPVGLGSPTLMSTIGHGTGDTLGVGSDAYKQPRRVRSKERLLCLQTIEKTLVAGENINSMNNRPGTGGMMKRPSTAGGNSNSMSSNSILNLNQNNNSTQANGSEATSSGSRPGTATMNRVPSDVGIGMSTAVVHHIDVDSNKLKQQFNNGISFANVAGVENRFQRALTPLEVANKAEKSISYFERQREINETIKEKEGAGKQNWSSLKRKLAVNPDKMGTGSKSSGLGAVIRMASK